jgi:divalent metal cation (Fe/Co/Zn/Cd) transporter
LVLVADALESLSDVLSGFAVYLGLKIAIEPPDSDHPYGHGKAEPFAALVVGLFLVGAALLIMGESVHEMRTLTAFRNLSHLWCLRAF